MSNSGIPNLTKVAYQLYVDGQLVGNVSHEDFQKLTKKDAPKFISVLVHDKNMAFSGAATINTEKISWIVPNKLD